MVVTNKWFIYRNPENHNTKWPKRMKKGPVSIIKSIILTCSSVTVMFGFVGSSDAQVKIVGLIL